MPLGKVFTKELSAAVRAPTNLPLGLAINAALFAGAWWLLPASSTAWLFPTHASWAFPTILAAWMLADTFATNVFASEAPRMLELIDDPATLRTVLRAKGLVLWVLVVPACTLVALIAGAFVDTRWYLAAGFVVIVSMPFGSLGIAPALGAVWPYHPIPIAKRWADRRRLGRRNLRWITLVVTPYLIIGPIAFVAITPTLILWAATSGGFAHTPPDWANIVGALLAWGTATGAWLAGTEYTLRLVHHRRDRLAAYLQDPTQG